MGKIYRPFEQPAHGVAGAKFSRATNTPGNGSQLYDGKREEGKRLRSESSGRCQKHQSGRIIGDAQTKKDPKAQKEFCTFGSLQRLKMPEVASGMGLIAGPG